MVENHLAGWLDNCEPLDLLLIESRQFGLPTSYDLGEDFKIVVLNYLRATSCSYWCTFCKAEAQNYSLNNVDWTVACAID